MVWQDLVLTIANIIFGYALIPQIYKGFKDKKGYINFQTALLSTIGLYAVTIVYFSLELKFSTIIGGFNATMWLLLLIQTIIYKNA